MLGRKKPMSLSTMALTLSLTLGIFPLQAGAACKGLEANACGKNDSCSWVKDYVRKDGVKVTGHCKTKPKTSSKSGNKEKSENKT